MPLANSLTQPSRSITSCMSPEERTNLPMSHLIRNRILLSIIVCLCAISLTIVCRAERRVADAFPPQNPQADKPVEQTRKNIQVLKGLPESQLFLLMNFMAVSIGEKCDFCHVTNGKDPKTGLTDWVWDSDEKPEKLTGRRMLQMVLLINGSNKVDFTQNSVTCYTCHRGQTTTVGLPSMPVAKSGHEADPNPTVPAASSRTRPTVGDVFARYLQAVGASNAVSTKTLFMKGTRAASQDRNWPNEITLASPDKLIVVNASPQVTVRQILNGEQGWILSGTNLRTLTATDAVEARRDLEQVFGIVKVTQAPGMQLAGVEKIDGRDTWVIAKSTPDRAVTYNFDAETGLLRRKKTVNHTASLPIPEQIDFEDYREVDGVKVPFVIRSSAIDTYLSWTRTFTEIKRNVPVDEKLFAPPATSPK